MIALILAATAHLASMTGDFDHDGRRDMARIVAVDGQYALRVTRGADPRHPITVWTLGRGQPGNVFVNTTRAGRFQTACGKGEGGDSDPCPRTWVMLKDGDLSFGYPEASESVAQWNGRRFVVDWLSD